jgi:hypothetical protein
MRVSISTVPLFRCFFAALGTVGTFECIDGTVDEVRIRASVSRLFDCGKHENFKNSTLCMEYIPEPGPLDRASIACRGCFELFAWDVNSHRDQLGWVCDADSNSFECQNHPITVGISRKFQQCSGFYPQYPACVSSYVRSLTIAGVPGLLTLCGLNRELDCVDLVKDNSCLICYYNYVYDVIESVDSSDPAEVENCRLDLSNPVCDRILQIPRFRFSHCSGFDLHHQGPDCLAGGRDRVYSSQYFDRILSCLADPETDDCRTDTLFAGDCESCLTELYHRMLSRPVPAACASDRSDCVNQYGTELQLFKECSGYYLNAEGPVDRPFQPNFNHSAIFDILPIE